MPSHALQILITNVLRGDADDSERAEYDARYGGDETFRSLVKQVQEWLAPLDSGEPVHGPRPELLDLILGDIRQSEKDQ